MRFAVWTFLSFCVSLSIANTEKTIFVAPESVQVPRQQPTLSDLKLHTLTPTKTALRTFIQAEFPTNIAKHGYASWFLLSNLEQGRRYEARICWAATQPTSFRLDTYQLFEAFESPALITSLAAFSEGRQVSSELQQSLEMQQAEDPTSYLFLRIESAADYYTSNQTLMKQVPPVEVEIILDPYVFNVLPQSLIPTIGYILVLAVASWYTSKHFVDWISTVATLDGDQAKKNM